MSIEAMKQALEVLEWPKGKWPDLYKRTRNATIIALRAAIEQAQEPVAWMWADGTITTDPDRADGTWTPLYIAPRQWQGLTKDEVDEWELPDRPTVFEFAQFVESKLKEKNG